MLSAGRLAVRPIEDIVRGRVRGSVVGFDPDATFEVAYHEITGWYEGPSDRIYSATRLWSPGAGHRRAQPLHDRWARSSGEDPHAPAQAGRPLAIPRLVCDPPRACAAPRLDLVSLIRARERSRFMCTGPTVADAYERYETTIQARCARQACGISPTTRERSRLPLSIASEVPGLLERLGPADRLSARQSSHSLPPSLPIDTDLAWLLGLYVAEGSRRRNHVAFANTDATIIEQAGAILGRHGVPTSRSRWAITACSALLSEVFGSLGPGDGARAKRVPPLVLGWSRPRRSVPRRCR